MQHPFDLQLSDLKALDLDFEEGLTDEEAAQVGGGLKNYTTQALDEEGGFCPQPWPKPKPIVPIKPPDVTTLALGEEGGEPIYPICPPVATTLAIGEEGGLPDYSEVGREEPGKHLL